MPSINLLGQNEHQKEVFTLKSGFGRMLASVGAVLLFVSVSLYAWFAFQEHGLFGQIDDKKLQIELIEKEISASSQRREILVRQSQLKEISKILSEYPYWSKLLPELSRVTLKSGGYASVTTASDYQLRVSVVLPDFVEFDKFLQVFENPKYNENLYNVRVVSANRFQSDQSKGVKVEMEMAIAPGLLKPKSREDKL